MAHRPTQNDDNQDVSTSSGMMNGWLASQRRDRKRFRNSWNSVWKKLSTSKSRHKTILVEMLAAKEAWFPGLKSLRSIKILREVGHFHSYSRRQRTISASRQKEQHWQNWLQRTGGWTWWKKRWGCSQSMLAAFYCMMVKSNKIQSPSFRGSAASSGLVSVKGGGAASLQPNIRSCGWVAV